MQRKLVPDVVKNQVLTVLPPSATVREAARLMAERNIGAVLVCEGERLAGIFTERDAVYRVLAPGRDPDRTSLAEAMTRDPETMPPDATALAALRRMHERGYRHLPVVSGGTLAGVVSQRDFLGEETAALEQQVKFAAELWERV